MANHSIIQSCAKVVPTHHHQYLVDLFHKAYIPKKNSLDASTLQTKNDHYRATRALLCEKYRAQAITIT